MKRQELPGRIIHLVKLVDAADSVVSQHQGTGLQTELLRFRILGHVSRQTHGGRTFTGSVLRPRDQLVNVLQQLRLGSTW